MFRSGVGCDGCFVSAATRAKMSMISSMSKMRGQEKGPGYTQTETLLGDSMQKFGRELGDESNFGTVIVLIPSPPSPLLGGSIVVMLIRAWCLP